MSAESARASQSFRQQLQNLHRKGDAQHDRKADLVREGARIDEWMSALKARWIELAEQARGSEKSALIRETLTVMLRIAGRTDAQDQSWQGLERDRVAIRLRREEFDSGHLDRIDSGHSKSETVGLVPLTELDKMHDVLKDATGEYFGGWDEALDANAADLQLLQEICRSAPQSEAARTLNALVGELQEILQAQREWVERLGSYYSGSVYLLDREWRLVRAGMERWEPLSN